MNRSLDGASNDFMMPPVGYRTDARGPGRSLALYRMHVPRVWMVLGAIVLGVGVALVVAIGPTPDNAALGAFVGLLIALLAWVVLLVAYGDRQTANFFTQVVHVLEISERGLVLRGPQGNVVGEQASRSLGVFRTNVPTTGNLILGGLAVAHASGTVRLLRAAPLGPWSGLPTTAAGTDAPFVVESALFDAMLRCAAE